MKKITYLFLFLFLIASKTAFSAIKEGYYTGLCVHHSTIYGNKTEQVNENFLTINGFITDNESMRANQIGFSVLAGYFHRLSNPNYGLAIEPSITYTPVAERKSATIFDIASNLYPAQSSWGRPWNFSLPIHLGLIIHENSFLYILTGVDLGIFTYKASLSNAGGENAIRTQKALLGASYGLGFTHQLENSPARIGLEIKNTHYKQSHTHINEETIHFNLKQKTNVFNLSVKYIYAL